MPKKTRNTKPQDSFKLKLNIVSANDATFNVFIRYLHNGHPVKTQDLVRAIQAGSPSVSLTIKGFKALFSHNNPDGAMNFFKNALETDPNNSYALSGSAYVLANSVVSAENLTFLKFTGDITPHRRYEHATIMYRQALQITKTNTFALGQLGKLIEEDKILALDSDFTTAKKPENSTISKAIWFYRQVLEYDPEDLTTIHHLAGLSFQELDIPTINHCPTFNRLAWLLGHYNIAYKLPTHLEQAGMKFSLTYLVRRVLATEPDNSDALINMSSYIAAGRIIATREDFCGEEIPTDRMQQAAWFLRKVLVKDPCNAIALYNLACLIQNGVTPVRTDFADPKIFVANRWTQVFWLLNRALAIEPHNHKFRHLDRELRDSFGKAYLARYYPSPKSNKDKATTAANKYDPNEPLTISATQKPRLFLSVVQTNLPFMDQTVEDIDYDNDADKPILVSNPKTAITKTRF